MAEDGTLQALAFLRVNMVNSAKRNLVLGFAVVFCAQERADVEA